MDCSDCAISNDCVPWIIINLTQNISRIFSYSEIVITLNKKYVE